ncbi:elongation factor P maturation arginine rhamnosyltransferase EarP [Aquabacterium sp.]|uniref:elongation factor P maturation arginine rhamnosyltransferase EarP n=1 Tax=Aquabacterium sp. TaxID=1872578 RepID=UPI0040382274
MLWDVFCRVIDNFGDIGVCWRLACDLGQRGHTVRLWVDDARALTWMAPQVRWQADEALGLTTGQGQPGVSVCRWQDAQQLEAIAPGLQAGDVVVEAFGCDPPDAFLARMPARAAQGRPAQWVNLEYLSAEDYVERSHGLRSPVWSGMAQGLHKRFFYPGFTPATGGLLREPGLIAQRESELGLAAQKQQWLRQLSLQLGLQLPPDAPLVLLFCYDSAPVGELLDRLTSQPPQSPQSTPLPQAHILLTPGPATQLAQAWLQTHPEFAPRLHELPPLPQADFDRLLWCCDLNLVRGEDSAVRALWAGRPHIWHIYEQDDGVHAAKLNAFMARWQAGWPEALQAEVRAWWLAWNRLGPMPDRLPDWQSQGAPWCTCSEKARAGLLSQQDLTSQLINFVASSG